MPVQTRAEKKRAADEGVYSRTRQSVKKKKQQERRKRTERYRASPEKAGCRDEGKGCGAVLVVAIARPGGLACQRRTTGMLHGRCRDVAAV